jgi:hypothetical protein
MKYLIELFYKVWSLVIILPLLADLLSYAMMFSLGFRNNFESQWMTSNLDWPLSICIWSTISALFLKKYRFAINFNLSDDNSITLIVYIIGKFWMFIAFAASYYLFDKSFFAGFISLTESNIQYALYLVYHGFIGYLLTKAVRK